jgi:hypothetical protein
MKAFSSPLGHGSGSVNLAASRYNASNKLHGTEFDPGNMGIAFGIIGLAVYLLLLVRALSVAYRLATLRRDAIGLFVLGIVVATLFQWTNGDLYSVCWLVWFALGAGDRLLAQAKENDEVHEPSAPGRRRGGGERPVRPPPPLGVMAKPRVAYVAHSVSAIGAAWSVRDALLSKLSRTGSISR